VIVPTRDRAIPVRHAIQSVLAQTWDDLEVVVVDDGSVDGTAEALRRMSDRRLVVMTTVGEGAARARNAGIAAARGGAVAFLDADDLYHPEKIERSMALLDEGAAFVHGPWIEQIGEEKRSRHPLAEGDARHRLLMFSRVATPTVVARTDLVRQAGGFAADLSVAEDGDLWLRLAALGPVKRLTEPLSTVRIGGDGIPRPVDAVHDAHRRIIQRFFANADTQGLLPEGYYLANAGFIRAYSLIRQGKVSRFPAALAEIGRYGRAAWNARASLTPIA
jgi:glycosyltransferase involved in cell wall biosynthesis